MPETQELGLILIAMTGILAMSCGAASLRRALRQQRKDVFFQGEVLSVEAVSQTDPAGRLFRCFWRLRVRCPKESGQSSGELNSTRQYFPGESVPLTRERGVLKEFRRRNSSAPAAFFTLLSGGGLALFAGLFSALGELRASYALCASMLLAGAALLCSYQSSQKRAKKASPLTGAVSRVLFSALEKNPRRQLLRAPDAYCPVIRYTDACGREREFISGRSSNSPSAYRPGDSVELLRDESSGEVFERHSDFFLLVFAAALLLPAAAGLISNLCR